MTITCTCSATYVVKPIPCPDGLEGCLTFHGPPPEAFDCPECGTRNLPRLSDGVHIEIGVGVGNVASIAKLDIDR